MQVQSRWQSLSSSTLYGYRDLKAAGQWHIHHSSALRFNSNRTQRCRLTTTFCSSSNTESNSSTDDDDDDDDGVEIEIENLGKNRRRIRSQVAVNARLQNVWQVLTDYERLADFIPGLAVSQLLEKKPNFARLLQIGEQDLAFGLKFNAKGVVDCFEKDLEQLPVGERRDIEFEMVEGDFKIFAGKWSIEQYEGDCTGGEAIRTTLLYIVDVEPKLWLPVRLIEGRLCNEIKINLRCVRDEAQKAYLSSFSSY